MITSCKVHRIPGTQSHVITKVHDLLGQPSHVAPYRIYWIIFTLDLRFCNKLYGQIVCIPMGIICATLVDDLLSFCYERDFMTSFSDEINEAFNSTSTY